MSQHRSINTQAGKAAGNGKLSVSIVIPAYNASRWIERTLRSVQGQTVKNIEVIVVDDGSTDETPAIVRRLMEQDPRIYLIQQSNGGVAKARNIGIVSARSEFVAPLDADDLWHPQRLELHLDAFADAPDEVALVYSPHVQDRPCGLCHGTGRLRADRR